MGVEFWDDADPGNAAVGARSCPSITGPCRQHDLDGINVGGAGAASRRATPSSVRHTCHTMIRSIARRCPESRSYAAMTGSRARGRGRCSADSGGRSAGRRRRSPRRRRPPATMLSPDPTPGCSRAGPRARGRQVPPVRRRELGRPSRTTSSPTPLDDRQRGERSAVPAQWDTCSPPAHHEGRIPAQDSNSGVGRDASRVPSHSSTIPSRQSPIARTSDHANFRRKRSSTTALVDHHSGFDCACRSSILIGRSAGCGARCHRRLQRLFGSIIKPAASHRRRPRQWRGTPRGPEPGWAARSSGS